MTDGLLGFYTELFSWHISYSSRQGKNDTEGNSAIRVSKGEVCVGRNHLSFNRPDNLQPKSWE